VLDSFPLLSFLQLVPKPYERRRSIQLQAVQENKRAEVSRRQGERPGFCRNDRSCSNCLLRPDYLLSQYFLIDFESIATHSSLSWVSACYLILRNALLTLLPSPHDLLAIRHFSKDQCHFPDNMIEALCDHGACSGALVLPVGLQNTDSLVVSAETVDSGLDENKAEFGVLVLSVALEVLADSDGLLDQHVEVFWNFWGETI